MNLYRNLKNLYAVRISWNPGQCWRSLNWWKRYGIFISLVKFSHMLRNWNRVKCLKFLFHVVLLQKDCLGFSQLMGRHVMTIRAWTKLGHNLTKSEVANWYVKELTEKSKTNAFVKTPCKLVSLLRPMFKQDETTSQEKMIQKEDGTETLLLSTENLERQKTEDGIIILLLIYFRKKHVHSYWFNMLLLTRS